MIQILTYSDGEFIPPHLVEVKQGWEEAWNQSYRSIGALDFSKHFNLKESVFSESLPPASRDAVGVRNPDLLFVAEPGTLELGGLEITSHSPDGSNIEKRYPFLWAGRRNGLFALVLTPYQKRRPTGAVNRLPHRAARRNLKLAEQWDEQDFASPLTQILPLSSLQDASAVPPAVAAALWTWQDVGALFAHRLAAVLGSDPSALGRAKAQLTKAKRRLCALHEACAAETRNTSASTLFVDEERVIQTYNARPESGHWERGEGQFDSIDGRLMVTMDDLELFQPELARLPFEFWLPQIARGHPWIEEQAKRGFKSKRLRNILVTLDGLVTTKFADQLTDRDWEILRQNPRLCLERDDRWASGLYRLADAFRRGDLAAIVGAGLARAPLALKAEVSAVLEDAKLFYGSFRAYEEDWHSRLGDATKLVPAGSTLLFPRIPKKLLPTPSRSVTVKGAEDCSRAELMALRQLHRSSLASVKAYAG